MLLLDKLLRRLRETGHRVLIFSQMVRMLDILAEYLQFRRFPFQRLDGSIKGELRRQALDHFNKPDSEDFCFLLSTRAGGLGINLATADTVIIYDSDWNPQNDLQAQARAHRIGQKNVVNIYRLVSKNSIEEDIVERAKQKMVLDHLVIQRMDTTGRTVLDKTSIPGNSSIPFTKEEINLILKFGAEELFKEKETTTMSNDQNMNDEKEELQMYDIDEILKRAETREDVHNKLTPSEELLSQFKVAEFQTVEDDPIQPNPTSNTHDAKAETSRNDLEGKSWGDIIPESERLKLEYEEAEKLLHFSLGNRRNRSNPMAFKPNAKSEDEEYYSNKSDEYQDDDDDDERERTGKKHSKKKSMKIAGMSQYTIKGLSTQEVRRFLKSYKKFPCPLTRIDIVAQDSHLEEKSQACLLEFAKKMQDLCKRALDEHQSNEENSSKTHAMKKKGERGPILLINGVTVNAQQIVDAEQYFEPLVHVFSNQADNKDIFLNIKIKKPLWDCEWTIEDDKSLLQGIYEYGYANWDWIKADPQLGLDKKILIRSQDSNDFNESRNSQTNENHVKLKPQSKHLRTRVDYLIKCLQNQINLEKNGGEFSSNANNNMNQNSSSANKRLKSAKKSRIRKTNTAKDVDSTNNTTKNAPQSSKSKRKHSLPVDGSSHRHHSSDTENSDSNMESKVKLRNKFLNILNRLIDISFEEKEK